MSDTAFTTPSITPTSIKQAVDRSREMLAQFTGPHATIAQAPPAAKLPASGIRQTSQSATADAKPEVTPATGATSIPSAGTVQPSVGIEQVNTIEAKPSAESQATPSISDVKAMFEGKEAASKPSSDPFALPPGFQMTK